MNDDWTETTDEREPFANIPTQEYVPEDRDALPRVVDLEGVSERDVRIVDAFFHELALEASEDPATPTLEEQDELDSIDSFVRRLTSGDANC